MEKGAAELFAGGGAGGGISPEMAVRGGGHVCRTEHGKHSWTILVAPRLRALGAPTRHCVLQQDGHVLDAAARHRLRMPLLLEDAVHMSRLLLLEREGRGMEASHRQ